MNQYTAFQNQNQIAQGDLLTVALAVKPLQDADAGALIRIFDDQTGRVMDIDTRGSADELRARLAPEPRPRGRPKLGVVAREITLLPRQWDWLASQQGGASATLRRLIDAARRDPQAEQRQRQDAVYRIATDLAGDQPGFEEALRALYANDLDTFHKHIEAWPADIRTYLQACLQAN